jgi:hypothetical protein
MLDFDADFCDFDGVLGLSGDIAAVSGTKSCFVSERGFCFLNQI